MGSFIPLSIDGMKSDVDTSLWEQFCDRPDEHSLELRSVLDRDDADGLGLQLAEAIALPFDPPGPAKRLADAIDDFAGPKTAVRVAELLLEPVNHAEWKIDVGLKVLTRLNNPLANLLLNVLSRHAHHWRLVSQLRPLLSLDELLSIVPTLPAPLAQWAIDDSLERAMIEGTSLGVIDVDTVANLQGVVFRFGEPFARLDPETGSFVDVEGEPVKTEDECFVAHPLDMDERQLSAWQQTFADFEIAPRFPQLDRLVPVLENVLFGDLNVDTDHWALISFLFPRGWARYAESRDFEFVSRGWKLTLSTRLNDDMTRRLLMLSLSGFSGSDDVGKFECIRAAYDLLHEFAPDVFY